MSAKREERFHTSNRQDGWAVTVDIDSQTGRRDPFSIVYSTKESHFSQGEGGYSGERIRIPGWVRELDYLAPIFSRELAYHTVSLGNRDYRLIMISTMEMYEIRRIIELIPAGLYQKLHEVGAAIRAQCDEIKRIDFLTKQVEELSRKLSHQESETKRFHELYTDEQKRKQEVVAACTKLQTEYDGQGQALKIIENALAEAKKEPDKIKALIKDMIDQKQLSPSPVYGETFYFQGKYIHELEQLIGCKVK